VRFKNSFQINFSDVLAPAPCQSKSSGKPEINHQEFTQLQQQLQDMKEQVRSFIFPLSSSYLMKVFRRKIS